VPIKITLYRTVQLIIIIQYHS